MDRIVPKIMSWLADDHSIKKMKSQMAPKCTLPRAEENRHHLHSKLNNEVSARHQLEEKSWKMIFFFYCLQPKLQLEINAKPCSWQAVLTNPHQWKSKTVKGSDSESLKTEAVSCRRGCSQEFKKWRVNYSENRLCKHPLDHHAEKKKTAQDTRRFLSDAPRFLSLEKRDVAFLRQKWQAANPDCCASEISEIKTNPGRSAKYLPSIRGSEGHVGSHGTHLLRAGITLLPTAQPTFLLIQKACLKVRQL